MRDLEGRRIGVSEQLKEINHRDALLRQGAPNRSGINHSGVQKAPTKMRFPVAGMRKESHLIPQSIETIQGWVVVSVEAAELGRRTLARSGSADLTFYEGDYAITALQLLFELLDDTFKHSGLVSSRFPALSSTHYLSHILEKAQRKILDQEKLP